MSHPLLKRRLVPVTARKPRLVSVTARKLEILSKSVQLSNYVGRDDRKKEPDEDEDKVGPMTRHMIEYFNFKISILDREMEEMIKTRSELEVNANNIVKGAEERKVELAKLLSEQAASEEMRRTTLEQEQAGRWEEERRAELELGLECLSSGPSSSTILEVDSDSEN